MARELTVDAHIGILLLGILISYHYNNVILSVRDLMINLGHEAGKYRIVNKSIGIYADSVMV